MPTHHLIRPTLLPCVALCVLFAAVPCAAQMLTTVTVTEKPTNAPVTVLPRSAFGVSDGNKPQEITSFVGADEPASVAVIFDLSGSARSAGLKRLNEAIDVLPRLVRQSNASNEYTVVTFAEEVTTLLEATRGPDRAEEALRSVYDAKAGKQSSLFDACWHIIPKLARGAHAKRIMILVTDGVDTYSRAREDDVTRQLKETNVVVYSINISDKGRGDDRVGRTEGEKVLENLSKVSGGLALAPRDTKEVGAAVERIADDVRGQYVVGFRPAAPPAAGKCLKFKTSVTPPGGIMKGVDVRAREEFCAPRPEVRKK